MKLLKKKVLLYAGAVLVLWSCKKDPVDNDPLLAVPPVQMEHVVAMIQFGEEMGGGKVNPTFEYIMFNAFQPVLAVEAGTVDAVVKNAAFNDYEIRIALNSSWMIIYDHITEPAVAEGDNVLPGQLLGNVGEGNRVELQINNIDGNSYCPFSYAAPAFVSAHKGFTEIWCIKNTITNEGQK